MRLLSPSQLTYLSRSHLPLAPFSAPLRRTTPSPSAPLLSAFATLLLLSVSPPHLSKFHSAISPTLYLRRNFTKNESKCMYLNLHKAILETTQRFSAIKKTWNLQLHCFLKEDLLLDVSLNHSRSKLCIQGQTHPYMAIGIWLNIAQQVAPRTQMFCRHQQASCAVLVWYFNSSPDKIGKVDINFRFSWKDSTGPS